MFSERKFLFLVGCLVASAWLSGWPATGVEAAPSLASFFGLQGWDEPRGADIFRFPEPKSEEDGLVITTLKKNPSPEEVMELKMRIGAAIQQILDNERRDKESAAMQANDTSTECYIDAQMKERMQGKCEVVNGIGFCRAGDQLRVNKRCLRMKRT